MTFIKLTLPRGTPIYLNADLLVVLIPKTSEDQGVHMRPGANCRLAGTYDDYWDVIETADEILALLSPPGPMYPFPGPVTPE